MYSWWILILVLDTTRTTFIIRGTLPTLNLSIKSHPSWGSCAFPYVISVSNCVVTKKRQWNYYHNIVSMEIASPKKNWVPFLAVGHKKYKATRIPIYQHSHKKFQASSAMKFATFHIKHMWLLLQNLNWLPGSKIVWAVYIKEKKSLYLSTNSVIHYLLISLFMSMNVDRI